MKKVNVIALCVLGAMCSPVVYAFQLGGFDIKPIIALQEKFDDNISSASSNVKSDFITLLSLALEGIYETKVESLSIKGTVEQKIFAKENDFNTTSEFVNMKFKRELSQFDRLTMDNNFTHADESTSFADEFGRTSGRYDYYKNFCTLGYEHDFTEQLTGKLKYSNEFYDPTIKTVSDSVLNRPGLELAYAFNSQTIASVFYDYSNRAFNPGGTVSIHSTAAGLRQYLNNQIYVDLKAGADFIKTIDDQDTIRPNYSAALTNEINETTKAGISLSKSHTDSFSSSDLFDKWSVSLFLGKELVRRLYLNAAAFTGGGSFATGSKEKFYGINLGLDFEISKDMKVNTGYTFIRRDSSVTGQDYDKNTVLLGLTINF